MLKIAALCHEIGHVHDIVYGINLKPGPVDFVEAEVFANLYALDLMEKRGLRNSFDALAGAYRELTADTSFIGDVARSFVQRIPECTIPSWHAVLQQEVTPEEEELLGPAGVAIILSAQVPSDGE